MNKSDVTIAPVSSASACAGAFAEVLPELTARLVADPEARVNRFGEAQDVFRQRVLEGLELLASALAGNRQAEALYTGQRMFEVVDPARQRDDNLAQGVRVVEKEWAHIVDTVGARWSTDQRTAAEAVYRRATRSLVTRSKRHLNTLLIGDCLMSEVVSFLAGPLIAHGVSFDSFPLNPLTPSQLESQLAKLPSQRFDVIFFSPFSHGRLPEVTALTELVGPSFIHRERVNELVETSLQKSSDLIRALALRFDCPIFVHNTSLLRRGSTAAVTAVGSMLTSSAREKARSRLNAGVEACVREVNAGTFEHVHIVDELAIARECGELEASRFVHTSAFQHATVLSERLAAAYEPRMLAAALLAGRKLVVCDLDNTLWAGTIGDGAVSHHHERQSILKKLRNDCGIVLSIASKNDPKNVHFDGGLLQSSDFVAPQISWGQKTTAIDTIARTLNLQKRHMVFIDDRPDERHLVSLAHPDVLVLDAEDPDTWRIMGQWPAFISEPPEGDRTLMYQQQIERDKLARTADADQAETVDAARLLEMGFEVEVSEAEQSDLRRVVELINRTNQWNLTGARTSHEQVRMWHTDPGARILLARARDRFGDLGAVCISVVVQHGQQVSIPVFVLSCRVFGYGVETAVLKRIREYASGWGSTHICGQFKATNQNMPCRQMYDSQGYLWVDDQYVLDLADETVGARQAEHVRVDPAVKESTPKTGRPTATPSADQRRTLSGLPAFESKVPAPAWGSTLHVASAREHELPHAQLLRASASAQVLPGARSQTG